MIIANIGSTKFILNDISEAQSLLNILDKAKQIDDTYIDDEKGFNQHFYETKQDTKIEIQIKCDISLTNYDEIIKMRKTSSDKAAQPLA